MPHRVVLEEVSQQLNHSLAQPVANLLGVLEILNVSGTLPPDLAAIYIAEKARYEARREKLQYYITTQIHGKYTP